MNHCSPSITFLHCSNHAPKFGSPKPSAQANPDAIQGGIECRPSPPPLGFKYDRATWSPVPLMIGAPMGGGTLFRHKTIPTTDMSPRTKHGTNNSYSSESKRLCPLLHHSMKRRSGEEPQACRRRKGLNCHHRNLLLDIGEAEMKNDPIEEKKTFLESFFCELKKYTGLGSVEEI